MVRAVRTAVTSTTWSGSKPPPCSIAFMRTSRNANMKSSRGGLGHVGAQLGEEVDEALRAQQAAVDPHVDPVRGGGEDLDAVLPVAGLEGAAQHVRDLRGVEGGAEAGEDPLAERLDHELGCRARREEDDPDPGAGEAHLVEDGRVLVQVGVGRGHEDVERLPAQAADRGRVPARRPRSCGPRAAAKRSAPSAGPRRGRPSACAPSATSRSGREYSSAERIRGGAGTREGPMKQAGLRGRRGGGRRGPVGLPRGAPGLEREKGPGGPRAASAREDGREALGHRLRRDRGDERDDRSRRPSGCARRSRRGSTTSTWPRATATPRTCSAPRSSPTARASSSPARRRGGRRTRRTPSSRARCGRCGPTTSTSTSTTR